jgi:serine/threonine-protein kinase
LAGAAFTGFEGGLLLIALSSLLPSPGISIGLLGMVIGGLIFAQYRRIIEGKDLPIIAGITLLVVMFLPGVKTLIASLIPGNPAIAGVLFVAIVAAAGAIAITALFRLIYKLLSSMF